MIVFAQFETTRWIAVLISNDGKPASCLAKADASSVLPEDMISGAVSWKRSGAPCDGPWVNRRRFVRRGVVAGPAAGTQHNYHAQSTFSDISFPLLRLEKDMSQPPSLTPEPRPWSSLRSARAWARLTRRGPEHRTSPSFRSPNSSAAAFDRGRPQRVRRRGHPRDWTEPGRHRQKEEPAHCLPARFANPLVHILLFAAAVSAFTGDIPSFVIIAGSC